MKRTLAAMLLVSGLGGCMSPDTTKKPGRFLDDDKAAASARLTRSSEEKAGRDDRAAEVRTRASEKATDSSVVRANATKASLSVPHNGPRAAMEVVPGSMSDPMVVQTAGLRRGAVAAPVNAKIPEEAYGPRQGFVETAFGRGGILPTPGMGPPGVVAGQGFVGPGQANRPMYPNQRTSIRFVAPAGMKIAFQDPARGFLDAGREAPVRYNFPQGGIYRLRLAGIPNRPGKNYYPTLEVYPTTQKTVTFLSHSTVPIGFSDEDFEQVNAGNLVVKVVYLPDPAFQDLAAAEEIVSTRLEPGVDPITEANRRGTILAVIRVGNIDLEDPNTPAMDAPPMGSSGGIPGGGMPGPAGMPGAPAASQGGPIIPQTASPRSFTTGGRSRQSAPVTRTMNSNTAVVPASATESTGVAKVVPLYRVPTLSPE